MNKTILQQFKDWKQDNLPDYKKDTLISNLSEVLSQYEPEIKDIINRYTD